MESKTIITDLTIEVELSAKNKCMSLVNELTSLIKDTDNEIILVDTSIFDDNKLIFTKREIPIVLLSHGNFIKSEFPNAHIQKYYVSVEFTELENCKTTYPLLVELIQLSKGYKIPYKLTKFTFALDIALQDGFHTIHVEKYRRLYPLEKAIVFIENRYRKIVRQQTTDNGLRVLTTLESRSCDFDQTVIEEALHNIKYYVDSMEASILDFNFIRGYLDSIFK